MTLTIRRVYHIAAFSWYAFVVKNLAAKDGEQLPPGIFVYGGPWKYLTFLNLVSTITSKAHLLDIFNIKLMVNDKFAFNIPVITNVILWSGGTE